MTRKPAKSILAKEARPFLVVFVLWGALVLIGGGYFTPKQELFKTLTWFLLFYGLCFLNLSAAGMALSGVFGLMKYSRPIDRAPYLVQTLIWGGAKLGVLGVIILALFRAREAPFGAVLAGISTLLIVPLIGGLSWSIRLKARKTLKKR
jgi:hypothetical protein